MKNNKGFSLVELIIVIAIMVILVAVLAPQFTKWVERSRVSTDFQTASEIAAAVQVDFTAGTLTANSGVANHSNVPSLPNEPKTKSKQVAANSTFSYTVDPATGEVTVKAGTVPIYPTPDAAYDSYYDK